MSTENGRGEVPGALSGVRVVEIGTFIAGPFAGQQLGDLGAEVVKIENPHGGDPMRQWRDHGYGDLWWHSIARNKQSVSLDLRRPKAQRLLCDLVAKSDVLLENFRPGTLEKWDLGPDRLHEINPSLVVTRVSGFGQTGPRSNQPGFGSVGEAMGGLRHLTGWPDRPSTRVGISLGDQLASLFAVIGTLAALRHAERTGKGQVVDTAIYEAVFALTESTVADYELTGVERGRTGPTLPGVVPSNVYPTKDGHEVLIAANSDALFARLAETLGLDQLGNDAELTHHTNRGRHADRVDKVIAERTRQFTAAELEDRLVQEGLPHGRIFVAADMLEDKHFLARNAIEHHPVAAIGEVAMPAPTPRLSGTPGRVRSTGPSLGQHTVRVLSELCGQTPTDIADLQKDGVI